MQTRQRLLCMAVSMALLLGGATLFTGCPVWWQPARTEVITLFSGDAEPLMKQLLAAYKQGQSEMAVEDIQSFTVTVTHIELHRAAADEPGDGEQNQTGGEQDPADIVSVFDGSVDVELKSLTGVSEVLSAAEVPPGRYTQIRLAIENPRLVLTAAPGEVETDIHLTANDQLFITEQFDVPENETSLLRLDFGGIHLVAQGNGGYTLTPQLRAELNVENADVMLRGAVADLDTDAALLLLTLSDGSQVEVDYATAQVYLPADGDTPTGTEADLALDQTLEVAGLINLQGLVTAQTISIQP